MTHCRRHQVDLVTDIPTSGAAANEYVAPKSMTLDMGKLLQGDDIQKDVET
jgi:hypothetical protein